MWHICQPHVSPAPNLPISTALHEDSFVQVLPRNVRTKHSVGEQAKAFGKYPRFLQLISLISLTTSLLKVSKRLIFALKAATVSYLVAPRSTDPVQFDNLSGSYGCSGTDTTAMTKLTTFIDETLMKNVNGGKWLRLREISKIDRAEKVQGRFESFPCLASAILKSHLWSHTWALQEFCQSIFLQLLTYLHGLNRFHVWKLRHPWRLTLAELELQMTHSAGPLDFVQLFWALEPPQLRCHRTSWNAVECFQVSTTF